VLAHRSGLYGVSGISGDLRRVLASDSSRARLAYDRFIWSLKRAVGAMAAVLGGVDTLVFTGGIGENSARVRADVAAALRLRLGEDNALGDRLISDGEPAVLVIQARDDLIILAEVLRALA
jgi:acetate kinase